jgi:hypothetical protein
VGRLEEVGWLEEEEEEEEEVVASSQSIRSF